MSLNLALFLMILLAIAGAVAFYFELDQKKKLLATAEQVMLDQQNHVLAVYDQIEENLVTIREHEGMITRDFEDFDILACLTSVQSTGPGRTVPPGPEAKGI